LSELKATGIELHEILAGRAGAAFMRDYCEGDPEVAYAAIALVYYPRTHERRERRGGEEGEADWS
jgi:hypothetical protein